MTLRRTPCARITCEVYQDLSRIVARTLEETGIRRPYIQSGRAIMMGEKRSMLLSGGTRLIEDLADIYRFTVPLAEELPVMNRIIRDAMLDQEGRGSIYSEHIESLHDDRSDPTVHELNIGEPPQFPMIQHLVGISCIVQRGQGNQIARAALEMGVCVPSVTFGIGAGLRDKLGLIRITIPAEKEIVNMVTTNHDAQGVLVRLIEAGKLDQPGKGFIFTHPIARGTLNTRLYVGRHLSAASLGQIVAALDEIKGSTGWRRKFTGTNDHTSSRRRNYLRGLTDVTVFCVEGQAGDLARVAMDAGANGATVSRLRRPVVSVDTGPVKVSPAREQLTMILPTALVDPVAAAVAQADLFGDSTRGEIHIRPCPEAYTYLGTSDKK